MPTRNDVICKSICSICLTAALSLPYTDGQALPFEQSLTRRTINRDVTFQWPLSADPGAWSHVNEWNVSDLLQELYGDEEFGDKIYAVKEFRFVPLVKGRVHLVALVDVTGRAFFNSIKAIYCQNRTCEVVSTHSFGDVDLRSQLIDTDHDGLSELVARDQVNVDWFPIFTYRRAKLRGEEFVDVSAESKEAWEKYVEPLIKADFDYQDIKLRELQQSRTVAKPADEVNRKRSEKAVQEFAALIDCARVIARADAARRVYGRPEAGVEDAAQWLQSPYQEIRELGLQTLVTIDSGLAAEVLTGVDMSAYPEWIVSSAQKMIKKRRPR